MISAVTTRVYSVLKLENLKFSFKMEYFSVHGPEIDYAAKLPVYPKDKMEQVSLFSLFIWQNRHLKSVNFNVSPYLTRYIIAI